MTHATAERRVVQTARVAALALLLAACGSGSHSGAASTTSERPTGTTAPRNHFPGEGPAGRTTDGRYLTLIDKNTYLVTNEPSGVTSTSAQRAAAERFRAATLRAVLPYRDPAVAKRAGYREIKGDAYHWVNPAFIDDAHNADPRYPESLIYFDLGDHKLSLIGVMYLEPGERHGPEVGGPETAWHYHRYKPSACVVASGFPIVPVDAHGKCSVGVPNNRSPEMLHVWVVNPSGPFSEQIYIPELADYRRALAHW